MTMISKGREITIVTPADWVAGPPQGDWTSELYATLPADGYKYEVVLGVLMMSPAPEMAHQGVIQRISRYLDEQIFSSRRGLVFTGPADVVLSPSTTVQPDILVVLKEHLDRVEAKRVIGAPDLVVEVISPSSRIYDRRTKYYVYEQAGVPEYWLVNAENQTIEVFVLDDGEYRSPGTFQEQQLVQSRIVPAAPAEIFFNWTGGLL